MAFDPNEVFVSGTGYTPAAPVANRVVVSKKIAAGTGTLAEFTPLWWDATADGGAGAYKPWVKTKAIEAFLFQEKAGNDGLVLLAGATQLVNVLWAGEFRRDALPTAVSMDATATEADLDAALCTAELRKRDFYIQGLVNFR